MQVFAYLRSFDSHPGKKKGGTRLEARMRGTLFNSGSDSDFVWMRGLRWW